jgi:serine phosphatase RsbU (regulator of sigma subunit)
MNWTGSKISILQQLDGGLPGESAECYNCPTQAPMLEDSTSQVAGHPSPLLLRRGKVSELYTEGSFPVGLVAQAEFTADTLKLEDGDTLVLFSDGISEAEDPDQEPFSFPRLCKVLAGRQEASLESLKKLVLDAVVAFARGASQFR